MPPLTLALTLTLTPTLTLALILTLTPTLALTLTLRQAFGGKAKAAELPDMCTPGIAGAATGRPKRA